MESFSDKGYLLRKSFFTAEESAEMTQAFEDMAKDVDLRHKIKIVPYARIKNESVKQKVTDMIQNINQNYGLNLNPAPDAAVFSWTDPSVPCGGNHYEDWQQDGGSYYTAAGNHYNYLNIYVHVYKEDPADANLGVVPFDVLRKKNHAAYIQAVGGGATSWKELKNHEGDVKALVNPEAKMICEDLWTGQRTEYDFDMGEIQTTHLLDVGDALILRGDMIHCQQPFKTKRIALSFRVECDRSLVSSSHYLNVRTTYVNTYESSLKMYANAWAFMKTHKKEHSATYGQIKLWFGTKLTLRDQAKFYSYRLLFYTYVYMRRYLVFA